MGASSSFAEVQLIAEFEIGFDAVRVVDNPNYHRAFAAALNVSVGVLCLDRDLGSPGSGATTASPIICPQNSGELNERLLVQGRRGLRVLILLPNIEAAFCVLELHGYVRSIASEAYFDGLSWMRLPPYGRAILVFGHDFEPAYVFQRSDPRP